MSIPLKIVSFIAFAPADDPQIACLVILDQPEIGMPYYGGTIAAPVVKSIMEETLQYLGVEPQYSEEEKKYAEIEVPDISGKTAAEAERILKEYGFWIRTKGSGGIVTDQIPKAHTKIAAGASVHCVCSQIDFSAIRACPGHSSPPPFVMY